ncbi:unnamed protein product [Amoebophrya sp. A120]|nr:unnamed protein product [Amoebophrya sp. A120]|eukprot:GSA120T00022894001.1
MAASSTGPPAVAGPASTGPPTSATATKPVRGLERHSDPCSFTVQEETLCVRRSALEKALGWKQNSSEYAELLNKLYSADPEAHQETPGESTSVQPSNLCVSHPPAVLLRYRDSVSIVPSVSAGPGLVLDTQQEIDDIAAASGFLNASAAAGAGELETAPAAHHQAPSSKSSGTTPLSEDNQAKLPQEPQSNQNPLVSNEEKAIVQQKDGQFVRADEYDDFAPTFLRTGEGVCVFIAKLPYLFVLFALQHVV